MALDAGVLKAALLWARNHINVGVKPHLKGAIVQRIDCLLANDNITFADMKLFRDATVDSTDAVGPKV